MRKSLIIRLFSLVESFIWKAFFEIRYTVRT
jgi:hypothetical protein